MELIIGEKLKNLRRSKDLTQEEVATHLGISFQAISKWERGEGYPDITMLAYYRYGNYEKALEYANKLPNLFKTRETALVRILKDDEEKNKPQNRQSNRSHGCCHTILMPSQRPKMTLSTRKKP